MQKTQNYQLNQYEPQDNFLRTDFNADNQKIDAALKGLDSQVKAKADQTALTQGLAKKCEIYLGSYIGNGNRDGTWQHISLGYRPRAVLICSRGGTNSLQLDYIYVQLATTDQTADCLEVTDEGFRVRGSLCYDWNNRSPYVFLAFV